MLIKNLPKKENKHFLVLTSHKYHIQKKSTRKNKENYYVQEHFIKAKITNHKKYFFYFILFFNII